MNKIIIDHVDKRDEDTIKNIWQEELLKVQTDFKSTLEYIETQLKYDMGNIFNFYDNINACMVVAKFNDNIIAFAAISPIESNIREYHLVRICVDPNFRKQGIATKLCENLLLWFKNKNIKELYTTVDTNNISCKTLLKKLNFHYVSNIHEHIEKWKLEL